MAPPGWRDRPVARSLACALFALGLMAAAPSAGAKAAPARDAESLYRNGMLASGKTLRGEREAGIYVEGAAAACAACHRRSGLGSAEGSIAIPPITGKVLFRARGRAGQDVQSQRNQGADRSRDAYSETSLARAIRSGIGENGRELSYLMPRYRLDDADMAALVEYLKTLNADAVPGVTQDSLDFATIITPDADPRLRQGMLDVIEHFFADKNDFRRAGKRALHSNAGFMFRVTRNWRLHVWDLTGAPETWERQLRAKLAAEPVFAVISGLGGKTWEPVHRFCEEDRLPCLFPNTDLPVDAEDDFYSLYFSKGVLLEAELVAGAMREQLPRPRRVVQLFRAGDIGEAGAARLAQALRTGGVDTSQHRLSPQGAPQELSAALAALGPGDALMLWLRPADIRALPAPAPRSPVFLSGLMAGLEQAPLPPSWRSSAHMSYPLDLPELRHVRMTYPTQWFALRHISVVDARIQADTYLACGIVSEVMGELLENFVRDFLVERIEAMLSRRLVTGNYPRLSLARGQRFASKGGYVVHFAGENERSPLAESGWMVP